MRCGDSRKGVKDSSCLVGARQRARPATTTLGHPQRMRRSDCRWRQTSRRLRTRPRGWASTSATQKPSEASEPLLQTGTNRRETRAGQAQGLACCECIYDVHASSISALDCCKDENLETPRARTAQLELYGQQQRCLGDFTERRREGRIVIPSSPRRAQPVLTSPPIFLPTDMDGERARALGVALAAEVLQAVYVLTVLRYRPS